MCPYCIKIFKTTNLGGKEMTFNPLEYWGKEAIRLTKENNRLNIELTYLRLKHQILGEKE